MKIFVIRGSAGYYSDAYDWLVCAYKNEAAANAHAKAALDEGRRLSAEHGYYLSWEMRQKYPNKYDPGANWDDRYLDYEVDEIELKEKFEP